MRCSKCGADNREGARFCDKCGAKLPPTCASCGAENRTGAKFCDSCGAAFGADAAVGALAEAKANHSPIRVTETSAAENVEGERKTVTMLFADIKGSMELIEDLDPEEARAIVDPALKLMIDAVQRYGGYVAQSTGDGIFALFGAPVAHEDHPQRALFAALRMQTEVRRYAEKLRAEKGVNLQVRVGANTGEVVVREIRTGEKHTDYAPIGHSTSVAARLEALAVPGSIVIGESVRKLVEGYFALKPLGPARIKGVSEPLEIYEVTGLGTLRTRLQRSAGRGLTNFVGREREMEALTSAAELAKSGHGQIVGVVAEPGVGKSRLFYEFKAKNESGLMVLETLSVSHEKASAYQPVIDLLHGYFRIASDDDARVRREKVVGRVLALEPSFSDLLPHLFSLLAIGERVQGPEAPSGLEVADPEAIRPLMFDALKRLLLRESVNQPLLIIFEDLHWIDADTQAFLDLLAYAIATARILLLISYRPEYRHEWGNRSFYTQLRLDPLGKKSAEEMVSALLGDGADLIPLKRLVIQKTEGNPFFIEELVQALFEQGVIARNGAVKLVKSLSAIQVPLTVQAVLASRIDRLPGAEKDLLQTLAVIGKEFPRSLAQRVVNKPDRELDSMLARLQFGEFVHERPAFPESEYEFKHTLTQEVAYNSLLLERRRALHLQTASALRSLYGERPADRYGELVHHYRCGADKRRAARYLYLAGVQGLRRSAFAHAAAQFTASLEMLEGVPNDPRRVELETLTLVQLAQSLINIKGVTEEVGGLLSRARKISQGTSDSFFLAIGSSSWYHRARGEPEKALILVDEALAKPPHDSWLEAFLRRYRGSIVGILGDFPRARKDFESVAALLGSSERGPARDTQRDSLTGLSQVLWYTGFPDQAREKSREATEFARQYPSRITQHITACNASDIALLCGDLESARHHLTTLFGLRTEIRSGPAYLSTTVDLLRANESYYTGWLLVREEKGRSAISPIREAMEIFDQGALKANSSARALLLAKAYAQAGQLPEASAALDEAQMIIGQNVERYYEAEVHRFKGEFLLMRGNGETKHEAERSFRRAIEIARTQSAKSWELRATVSLARLLTKQDKRDEARTMLAEIYNWFTEGFETADLKDAKALLDELSNSPS